MRGRNVPLAPLARLVVVQAGMNPQRHFQQRPHKIEIRGRVVHRISAKNQQHLHFAAMNVVDQRAQRLHSVNRVRFQRLGVIHRLAHVAQRRIQRMRQRMHRCRLLFARHHHRTSAMRRQIFRYRLRPIRRNPARARSTAHPGISRRCGQFARERFHV